jgi:SAGA-associated factor 73
LNKKQEKLKKKKEAKEAKDAALRKEKGEDDDVGIGARKSAIKGTVMDGEGAKKGKKRKSEEKEEGRTQSQRRKAEGTRRCGEAVWCAAAEWRILREELDVQEP